MIQNPENIAVACALSPRFRAVLAEAGHFAGIFGARFSILHAGQRSAEREGQFSAAVTELGLPANTAVHWAQGEPATALLDLATTHGADLLIAGALERDVEMQFLSGVARKLLQATPCSLLLFTQPCEQARPFRRIVVVTDFTETAHDALRLALFVAERDQAESLHILSVFTPFAAARAKLGTEPGPARHECDEEAHLDEFASIAADSPVPVETRVIQSTTGMAAADFAKSIEADLLVVPAQTSADGQTVLPTYMDWVMQVIPCNLWVVKPPR